MTGPACSATVDGYRAGREALPAPAPLEDDLAPTYARARKCGSTERLQRPQAARSRGTWFDPDIDLREPEGSIALTAILDLIAASECRKCKRRRIDDVHHRTIVRKILANGLRCFYHREVASVAYSRRAEGYRDKPAWLSGRAMGSTIDLMRTAGLLTGSRGQLGTSSTYSLDKAVYSAVEHLGVSVASVTLQRGSAGLIRLRAGNRESSLMPFVPTPQTQEWEAALQAYNTFLAAHNISVPLTSENAKRWVCRHNENQLQGIPLKYPELFRNALYRQFNNGSFFQGGRLYGGWWIHCPKEVRSDIQIDGKATIELDYSGCAIRMLYHLAGIDYQEDPYFLDPIASCELAHGIPVGYYREDIKAITQALINGNADKNPEPIAIKRSFAPYFTRTEIRSIIEEKHNKITDKFGSSKGTQLQTIESNIALSVIHVLAMQNILALPIHDSFLVKSEYKNALHFEMDDQYHQFLGFFPLKKQAAE